MHDSHAGELILRRDFSCGQKDGDNSLSVIAVHDV